MKFKGTALMAAVFLCLALYYFFVDLPAEQKEKIKSEKAEKILPLEPDEVSEFSITRNGNSIALKQNTTSKNWDMVLPLSASGDYSEVETFLSEIGNLKKTRVVDDNPEDLSVYGLSSPSISIHFKFTDQHEETLLLGNESPMGGDIYFKLKSQPSVVMASTSRSSFEKSVYSFRDKTLINFSTGTIKRIQIIRENNPLEFNKKEGVWQITGALGAQGDNDAIMNFLQSIQFSKIHEFIDEAPNSLEPYGLNSPKLKLVLEDEKGKVHTLALGKHKNDNGYFGKINNSSNVILIDTKLFQAISQKAVAFLDKTLLKFEEKEVLELSLQSDNETIQIVRGENENWGIQSPIKTTADLSTINSLLFDLKEAKITEFIKISLDIPTAFGLDTPNQSINLKMKNGKTWSLQFGNQTSNGKEIFANRTGESTVFSISKEVVQKLFRSLYDLRNKKILEFDNNVVNKILIQTSEKNFVLRKTNNEWNLEKPEKIKTQHIGRDLVWALKSLEFNSIVAPPLDENLAGLDTPLFTISIWKDNQEKIATMEVGKHFDKEQEYIVQTDKRQFRIKSKFLDSIPLTLDNFKP
jgi:hypothetical protein